MQKRKHLLFWRVLMPSYLTISIAIVVIEYFIKKVKKEAL